MKSLVAKICNHCRSHREDLLALFLFTLISFNTLTWFKGHKLIIQLDNIVSIINPKRLIAEAFYSWRDYDSLGRSVDNPAGGLFIFFYYLLYVITRDIGIAQRIVYFSLFLAAQVTMYALLRKLIFKEKNTYNIVFATLISVIYAANPITLSCFVWYRIEFYTIYYIFQPIFLMILLRVIYEHDLKKLIRHALAYSMIMQLFLPSFTMVTIQLLTLFTSIFTLTAIIISKGMRRFVLRNIVVFSTIFIAISSWSLIPYIYSILSKLILIERVTPILKWLPTKPLPVAESWSKYTTILNSLDMLGHPYIWYKWKGIPLFPWSHLAFNPMFRLISHLFALVSVGLPLLMIKYMDSMHRRLALIMSIELIITLFLMKGINEPLGIINKVVFSLTFLAPLTRHYYYKVGILLPFEYVLLLSLGIHTFQRIKGKIITLKYKTKLLLLVVLIFLLIVSSAFFYPFAKGYVVPSYGFVNGGPVDIPSEYYNLSNIIKDREYSKILVLPPVWGPTEIAYSWPPNGTKTAGDQLLTYFLFNKSVIQYASFVNIYADRFVIALPGIFAHTNITTFISMLQYLGFEYIVIHKDVDSRGSPGFAPSPRYYEAYIESYKLSMFRPTSVINRTFQIRLNHVASNSIKIEAIIKLKKDMYYKNSSLQKMVHTNLIAIELHDNKNNTYYFYISLHMNKYPHIWLWVWDTSNNKKDLVVTPAWILGVNNWNNVTGVLDLHHQLLRLYINNVLVGETKLNNIKLDENLSIKFIRANVFSFNEYGCVKLLADNETIVSIGNKYNSTLLQKFTNKLLLIFNGQYLKIYKILSNYNQNFFRIAYSVHIFNKKNSEEFCSNIILTKYNSYHKQQFYSSNACLLLYITNLINKMGLHKNLAIVYSNDNNEIDLANLKLELNNAQKHYAIFEYIKKLNPTKYKMIINASGPFMLILLQAYDPLWTTYINGTSVSQKNHYVVFGCLNGWFINAKGRLEIIIQYQLQYLWMLSSLISITTIISLVFILNVKKFVSVIKS